MQDLANVLDPPHSFSISIISLKRFLKCGVFKLTLLTEHENSFGFCVE
jgi:hypothetical protein